MTTTPRRPRRDRGRPRPLQPDSPLKQAIYKSGLRQYQLARLMNIREDRLSMIVSGRSTPNEIERQLLRKYLKRPLRELFPSAAIEPEDARTA